ncbi:hypothetical protein GW17_00019446 [Ensete ventricosum]|nr:hypothetical protein GW17_00019446 [Ensete ventricosum]
MLQYIETSSSEYETIPRDLSVLSNKDEADDNPCDRVAYVDEVILLDLSSLKMDDYFSLKNASDMYNIYFLKKNLQELFEDFPAEDRKLLILVEMGFPINDASAAIARCGTKFASC